MRKILKSYKILIGIIVGMVLAGGGVYAATTIGGNRVTYSNTKSDLESTNVQDAIDELYEKLDIRKADKFVVAYTYNETEGASDYCVTGGESTCKRTTCYKNKTAGSCPSGTIIFYKVNDLTIVPFHVMFDQGVTMTMQSQRNTVYKSQWISKTDYTEAGGTNFSNGVPFNEKGPLSILLTLERAVYGWTNVNDQIYTLGTTSLSGKGEYTKCDYIMESGEVFCTTNIYTLPERRAKARMMTVQEARSFGCLVNKVGSCPIWIYNFLENSIGFGGTRNDLETTGAYWLSTGVDVYQAATIFERGYLSNTSNRLLGTRAVVEVSK